MLEKAIENRLKIEVEKINGMYLKFIPTYRNGMPDRIALLPGAKIYWIELKAPNKKLRALQIKRKKELEALGFDCRRIDTLEKVKSFIEEVSNAK